MVSARARRQRIGTLVVLFVVVAVLATWLALGRRSHDPSAQPRAVASGSALVVGDNADARTKVTIYEDFLCPFCHELELSSRDMLRRDAADGKVLITYRPFQLLDDPYSRRALSAWFSVLAQGSGEQALAFHDQLYDHQPYENASDKPGVSAMREWAQNAGVGKRSVLDAIGGPQTARYVQAQRSAIDHGVQSTPWVFIDGRLAPGTTPQAITDDLRRAIEQ